MTTNYNLTEEEIPVIKTFQKRVEASKIWHENKLYLNYFIKSLFDNNFMASASLGFVFLEKYLRSKLIILECYNKSIPDSEILNSLDEVEKTLEDWNWMNIVSDNFNSLKNTIQKYWNDNNTTKEQIRETLEKYFTLVESKWWHPKSGYYFNDICKKLNEYWKITNRQKRELIKLYGKYRNPLNHWLFKRLINDFYWNDTMPVYCWWIENPWFQTINISNIIIREWNDYLTHISREITFDIFQKIQELIDIFSDYNINNN